MFVSGTASLEPALAVPLPVGRFVQESQVGAALKVELVPRSLPTHPKNTYLHPSIAHLVSVASACSFSYPLPTADLYLIARTALPPPHPPAQEMKLPGRVLARLEKHTRLY